MEEPDLSMVRDRISKMKHRFMARSAARQRALGRVLELPRVEQELFTELENHHYVDLAAFEKLVAGELLDLATALPECTATLHERVRPYAMHCALAINRPCLFFTLSFVDLDV